MPPAFFDAGGFHCGYDLAALMCWVGRPDPKQLDLRSFSLAVAHAKRRVLATPVQLQVSAPDEHAAAAKVIQSLAARQGKKTSPSVSAFLGGCALNGNLDLPGVRTWGCTVFDSKPPNCSDQVFLYRTDVAGETAGSWRWDAIGGTGRTLTCG